MNKIKFEIKGNREQIKQVQYLIFDLLRARNIITEIEIIEDERAVSYVKPYISKDEEFSEDFKEFYEEYLERTNNKTINGDLLERV